MEESLKSAGSSMDKVLKVTVYLTDMKDYDGMNETYLGRFGSGAAGPDDSRRDRDSRPDAGGDGLHRADLTTAARHMLLASAQSPMRQRSPSSSVIPSASH